MANARKRVLLILDLLYRETDEEHPASTRDLIAYLAANGIAVDRKTLRGDMEVLMSMGYDIVMVKSSPNKYFWGDRLFEVPELKMLLDAVASSRFITKRKSDLLMKKIESLAGEPQSRKLRRHMYAIGRTKTDNRSIYYIVDTVTDAINERRKIAFKYTEYNGMKEKVFRNDGEVYILSPYALYWNADYYYVVGYSQKREDVVAFRMDRLYRPCVIDEKADPKPKGFKIEDYEDRIFNMYDGEETTVELRCADALMKYIVDKFGMDVTTNKESPSEFTAKVPVTLSPTFYSWVFQFGGRMRITSPPKAVAEFQQMCLQNMQGKQME